MNISMSKHAAVAAGLFGLIVAVSSLPAQAPLVALNEVERGGFFRRLWDSFWMWWESE